MAKRLRFPYLWLAIVSLAVTLLVFAYTHKAPEPVVVEPAQSQPDNSTLSVVEEQASAEDTSSLVATEDSSLARHSNTLQAMLASCKNVVSRWQFSDLPPQETALAHPSNYGQRFLEDTDGNVVTNQLLVVLHETVDSASSAINTFQVSHAQDSKQVSYHDIIRRDGTIVNIVPITLRAFGAGNSVFEGTDGSEAVATNPALPASVNNFAYHIALESPPDSDWEATTHSGYTNAQYRSLAWLIARTCTPESRVVTHKSVDRSGMRRDPRSFEREKLLELLTQYPDPEIANFSN